MSDAKDLIAKVDAALEGVTPGPWDAYSTVVSQVTLEVDDIRLTGESVASAVGPRRRADARFIAAARTLVPALRAALAEDERVIAVVEIGCVPVPAFDGDGWTLSTGLVRDKRLVNALTTTSMLWGGQRMLWCKSAPTARAALLAAADALDKAGLLAPDAKEGL